MTTPTPGSTPATPKWKPLDARQRRVLGVLIEKAKTTPAAYPITVNALVAGCNQKNNRDPLTQYDNTDVEKALDELRTLGVVSEIDWLGRVSKYKHQAYEWLGVSKVEIAVMTELLLRGAQQLGELRGRAARMEAIADLAALKLIIDGLLERGLVIELSPAGRGQVVSHNLYPPSELSELKTQHRARVPRANPPEIDERAAEPPRRSNPTPARSSAEASPAHAPPMADAGAEQAAELAQLRNEVAALRDLVTSLQDRVRELAARLG